MGSFTGKFDSAKQDWITPDDLFNRLDERFNFEWDLAADEINAKCKKFYTKEQDGLSQEWQGVCWLNPPYGSGTHKLSAWVKKASESDATVVMLIPARTNTKWWHKYCLTASSVIFLEGRPKFGGAKHGLPQPLAIIVFDKNNPIGCTKFESMKV